ncbi:unnamed protein product [Candida verbasci]|uniref:tRNA-splicing endonuclease subunit Sen15 domain-containing protein n=1 Tax=Candida verbasci TaxID=1227364 RepID=A0A9W4TW19_9ASCO|nr:unnamed protein product [Candida verbasci]
MSSTLIEQFKTNLIHYNLWNNVKIHNDLIISGIPSTKLVSTDDSNQIEWIMCIDKLGFGKELSIKIINSWFKQVQSLNNNFRPSRITIGIMNDDGTIVYYFVYDGITKPRQN